MKPTTPKTDQPKPKQSLSSDFQKLLPTLRKLEPYLFGAALVGVFAYTALVVNGALNVQPATVGETVDPKNPSPSKITFDKNTIEAVKKLNVVQGNVPVGDLGKDDPFK